MRERPVTSADIARDLGVTVDTFYRNRARYHALDGLPQPFTSAGRPKWDRATYEAWRGRHHPQAPQRPANDTAPPLAPDNAEAWRAHLAATYASHKEPA